MNRPGSRPPAQIFDHGMQHERTALAWERTAISTMVAGVILARYAAQEAHLVFAAAGIGQTIVGAGLVMWAGWHYTDLHGPLRSGVSIVHPTAAKLVGLSTVFFSAVGLALAVFLSAT